MENENYITVTDLPGMEVSGIEFVRDYIEIHFDGPILRCISYPTVQSFESRWKLPEPGSRDAICELIGTIVESVDLDDDTMLTAKFSNGYKLFIPLDMRSRRDPEAMHFVPGINLPIQVW